MTYGLFPRRVNGTPEAHDVGEEPTPKVVGFTRLLRF